MSKPSGRKNEIIGEAHHQGILIESREIFLTGYEGDVSEEPGVDYRMATRFERNMRLVETLNPGHVLVHMHSVGGEWADGISIYDTIKAYPYNVTILAYAHARSMTSIILQAADLRVMMPHSYFMIHYGSLYMDCNEISAYSLIEFNQVCDQQMLDIYAERCNNGQYFQEKGIPEAKIRKFLDSKMREKQEWYLTAQDAVYYGFADAILGQENYENIAALLQSGV
jgi:ATP-dependent protease ClpP protease subunit